MALDIDCDWHRPWEVSHYNNKIIGYVFSIPIYSVQIIYTGKRLCIIVEKDQLAQSRV